MSEVDLAWERQEDEGMEDCYIDLIFLAALCHIQGST